MERDNGSALRNDGLELKPAAQNPWYVLAAVNGAETGTEVDQDLHAKNRRIWDGWTCSGMDEGERRALADKLELPVECLAPLAAHEEEILKRAFADWFSTGTQVPEVEGDIDFGKTHLSNTAVLERCVFGRYAVFQSATFGGSADISDGAFAAATTLRQARFEARVPKFFQRDLHQNTVFTEKDVNWRRITSGNAEAGKQAYTRLRCLMIQHEKPDDERFFFRPEMRSKVLTENGLSAWLVWFHRFVSDYGYSGGRPLGALGLLFLLGLTANGAISHRGARCPSTLPTARS